MSGAMAGRSAGTDGHKGRIEATKVKRYRPGQVPEWMKSDDQETELPFGRQPAVQDPSIETAVLRSGIAAPVIVKKADDPRLARLAAAGPVDRAAALRERHAEHAERDIAAPQIVRRRERPPSSDEESDKEEEEERKQPQPQRPSSQAAAPAAAPRREGIEEDGEDEITARRAALKARLLEEERATAATAAAAGEEEEQQEEESSEYETDDSEEDGVGYFGHKPLAKPVFVPRTDRETIAERDALERQLELEAEQQRLRLEQRKEETKEIIVARLAEEAAQEAAAAAGPKGAEDIVTDDEAVDEEEEYQNWKLRELRRIGRDREERERELREAAERERWKNMSEEERLAFLAAQPKTALEKTKKKFNFLQKYYHRGAFFQTEAEWKGEAAPLAGLAAERDFSAPTGLDRVDRQQLPEVMQVKNFGRKGRSKWTHLAAEDTTDRNAPWAQDPVLRRKAEARMAGTEQVFTKPKNTKT